jgi:hypothetical protein
MQFTNQSNESGVMRNIARLQVLEVPWSRKGIGNLPSYQFLGPLFTDTTPVFTSTTWQLRQAPL